MCQGSKLAEIESMMAIQRSIYTMSKLALPFRSDSDSPPVTLKHTFVKASYKWLSLGPHPTDLDLVVNLLESTPRL